MKLLCSSFIVSLGRFVQNYPVVFLQHAEICGVLEATTMCCKRLEGVGGGVCVHVEARQIKILGPVQTAAPAAALGSADSADCDANDKPAAPTPAFYILWCEV